MWSNVSFWLIRRLSVKNLPSMIHTNSVASLVCVLQQNDILEMTQCLIKYVDKKRTYASGYICQQDPDSKVHGANMGPIWGRQDPGGPHLGAMYIDIWEPVCIYGWASSQPMRREDFAYVHLLSLSNTCLCTSSFMVWHLLMYIFYHCLTPAYVHLLSLFDTCLCTSSIIVWHLLMYIFFHGLTPAYVHLISLFDTCLCTSSFIVWHLLFFTFFHRLTPW